MKKIFKAFHKPVPYTTKVEPIQLTKEEFIDTIDKIIGKYKNEIHAFWFI